jgi:hypothetical protein
MSVKRKASSDMATVAPKKRRTIVSFPSSSSSSSSYSSTFSCSLSTIIWPSHHGRITHEWSDTDIVSGMQLWTVL